MRYAGITKNDVVNAPGVCVSVYLQGCPIRCEGCHNASAWSFTGGKELTLNIIKEIGEALVANGVKRSLCILGGEPLCNENLPATRMLISYVKTHVPETKIYLWTGYTFEELLIERHNSALLSTLAEADVLIDGPFVLHERDVSLFMRGSRNQRVLDTKKSLETGGPVPADIAGI